MKLINLDKIKADHPSLYNWSVDYLNSWGMLKSHSLSEEDDEIKKEIKHHLLSKLETILNRSNFVKIEENDEVGKFIESLRKELDEIGYEKFEEKYISHKFDFYAILTWFLDNYWIY